MSSKLGPKLIGGSVLASMGFIFYKLFTNEEDEDVIRETNNILKKKINYEYGPRRKDDIEYSVADNTKFKNKFKWKAKYNLNDILMSSLEWEKNIKK